MGVGEEEGGGGDCEGCAIAGGGGEGGYGWAGELVSEDGKERRGSGEGLTADALDYTCEHDGEVRCVQTFRCCGLNDTCCCMAAA